MNTFMDRVNAIVQNNQASMAQDVSYPDAGIGALENVANNVPRQTEIMGQPHMLAYINPQEEQALRDMGGAGMPGPDGIPAYYHAAGHGSGSNREWNERQAAKNYVAPTDAYGVTLLNNPTRSQEKAMQAERASRISSGMTPFASTTNREGGTGVFRGGVEDVRVRDSKADRVAKTAADARAYAASRRTAATPTNNTGGTFANQTAPKTGIAEDFETKITGGNTFYETLANIFTPFDGTTYKGGNLMDNKGGPATNVGTKTYYGTVGMANNQGLFGAVDSNDDFPVEGFGALQAKRDEGPLSNAYDYIKGQIPSTVAGALVPGAGMFLNAANTLGTYRVGPNPRDLVTGIGESGSNKGQEIRQNAKGEYYTKGALGNYYLVGGPTDFTPSATGLPATPETSASESKRLSFNNAMMAASDKSNNMSAGTGSYAGTVASGGGGGGGGNAGAANSIFNRYYKGGSGFGLPPWLAKYASGTSFDKVLSKTTIDGKEYYETPDGQYLDAAEVDAIIVNATVTPET